MTKVNAIPFLLLSHMIICPLTIAFMAFLFPLTPNLEHSNKYQHWRDALADELSALEQNHTWILTCLPVSNPLAASGSFKKKLKSNGELDRYKG